MESSPTAMLGSVNVKAHWWLINKTVFFFDIFFFLFILIVVVSDVCRYVLVGDLFNWKCQVDVWIFYLI